METYFEKIDAKAGRIRDPLYGFIPLTENELKIIDTPIFQRLRRIHQLALTKYVYPSAEHSRFVHSLGVMHCATLILEGLMTHKQTNIDLAATSKFIKTLRYAALLHDIGHLPFSHAVESHLLHGLKHEDVSMFIIENYPPIVNIINSDSGIDSKDVAALLGKTPKARHQILHEIVSGQLDADRADYLLRDSHICGTRYGEYDFHRFLQIFAAQEDDNGTLSLCIDEKDLPVAESLLIARYHYNIQIPFHRTRSGYDFALKVFCKKNINFDDIFDIDDNKIKSIDFDKFSITDDGTIFELVKEKYLRNDAWAKCLLRQTHLHPIMDITTHNQENTDEFKEFVNILRNTDDIHENEDYFVQEQKVEMIKKSNPSDESSSSTSTGGIRLLIKQGRGQEFTQADITKRSWIFAQLDNVHKIYRVYAAPGKKEKILSYLP